MPRDIMHAAATAAALVTTLGLAATGAAGAATQARPATRLPAFVQSPWASPAQEARAAHGLAWSKAATPGKTFAQRWVERYNAAVDSTDDPLSLAVAPNGRMVFVTGQSYGGSSTGWDYATVAYCAFTGKRLWAARYSGPGSGVDSARSVAVSPDSSTVFVAGGSWVSGASYDYATVAYNATTGKQLWAARYNGPAKRWDYAEAVAVSRNGAKVFVTGGSRGRETGDDYATVAYNATTGKQLWVTRYNGQGKGTDYAHSVVSPAGGKVFVTGLSRGSGTGSDFATVAYRASTGVKLWVKRYNGPGNSADYAFSLAATSDGTGVFVTGDSFGARSGVDYATVAYRGSTGKQLWVKRYNGPANGWDYPTSVATSPRGAQVLVTGYSPGATSTDDYATIAYRAATGAQLWVRRYNGPGNGQDSAASVAVSPDGAKVFVTGTSQAASGNHDYATVAYNAGTGAQLWVKRYNGAAGGLDVARAVAVSRHGSKVYVFVTGQSWGGNTTDYDYATVAYRS